jgi:hypothetical protein
MLGSSDIARSPTLYEDLSGLSVKTNFPGFTFVDTGAADLCIREQPARSTDNLEAVTATDWAANIRDLDGHKLSIFGPKPSA